jgi:enoyl-CoA hydratase
VSGDEVLAVEQVDGSTLVLRIQREHKRNAIDRALTVAIEAALDRLERDPQLRVGIVTGGLAVFSAGTDIFDPGEKATERGGEYGIIRRRRSKALIAAVEGLALGGGFEIVLACDLVVASTTASFGLPEGRIGRIATSGGLFRAPRALPRSVAAELLLSGLPLDAARGYALGLVNRLAERGQAVAVARALALEIGRSSPASVAASLQVLATIDEPVESLGWPATAAARVRVMAGEDAAEGTRAFREKRLPRWTGG